MEEKYREAFSEVYEILNQMTEENRQRIPKKFIEFIKDNRNKEYINEEKSKILYKKEKLKRETKIILSIIYRNYFCTPEERKKKQKEDDEILKEIYSYDKLFKKSEKEEQQNQIVIYKENFFKKTFKSIFDKIKNIIYNKREK